MLTQSRIEPGRLDKSYRDTSLGAEAAEYLRLKRKRLTDASYRRYEGTLAQLALQHPKATLSDLEPPFGVMLIEEFLACNWGHRNPKTYNNSLTAINGFCHWLVLRGKLLTDPAVSIERARPRAFHRSTFTPMQRQAIIDATRNPRYRVAVRLLLDYGIRKGALAQVKFEHFDRERQRLTIFTKGESVHTLPLPDLDIWNELDMLFEDPETLPWHYLMCRHHARTSPAQHPKLLVKINRKSIESTHDLDVQRRRSRHL